MTPNRLALCKRAAAWLALLGALFYLSYGAANWWASTRTTVPSVVFDWEHQIPFMPWTIFPYWTINAFYALSLFLAWNRRVLDRHAARLLTAQLVAVTCFVLWPLRFSFGTPPVEGAPAFLFDALRSFDRPFNQAPSLHITLAVVLWDWYRRLIHRRWLRVVLHLWTFAICASVLTTWQHHFMDIPTGALLGLLCVWMWPLEAVAPPWGAWRLTTDAARQRLALVYGIGALATLLLGLSCGSSALWLAWPAFALLLVALNYLALGAHGFAMRRDGTQPWAMVVLLWPYIVAARLNARLWTRGLPPAVSIAPGFRLGRIPTEAEWQAAGKPLVLSLCAELEVAHIPGARCVPMLDLVLPSEHQLRRAVSEIEAARTAGRDVWVCCALGFSRSALVAVAWLVRHGGAASVDAAEQLVRRHRPTIVLRGAWRERLHQARLTGSTP